MRNQNNIFLLFSSSLGLDRLGLMASVGCDGMGRSCTQLKALHVETLFFLTLFSILQFGVYKPDILPGP